MIVARHLKHKLTYNPQSDRILRLLYDSFGVGLLFLITR